VVANGFSDEKHSVFAAKNQVPSATPAGEVLPMSRNGEGNGSATLQKETDVPVGGSADVSEFLQILWNVGDVYEMRAPETPYRSGKGAHATASGFFDNLADACRLVGLLHVQRPPGIYVTLNPVHPSLLARSCNQILHPARHTTSDADILQRDWLLIDIDPVRRAGISATESEMQVAIDLANRMRDDLSSNGWPSPLLCCSGNGSYLLYRVSLPNDDQSTDLVRRTLIGLGARYDTDAVKVDRSTFNPSRIAKLIGTYARKGENFKGRDSVPARPHRQSWFERPSGPLNVVPRDLLESVAAPAKPAANTARADSLPKPANQNNILERCRRYVAAMPDAVSGQGGHAATLQVACETQRFGLSDAESWQVLSEFNATRTAGEPWTNAELDHKLADAKKKVAAAGEIGLHLSEPKQKPTENILPPEDCPIEVGTLVRPGDRDNFGTVIADNGRTATVHFVSPDGREATKEFPKSLLRLADGAPVVPGPRKSLEVIHVRDFIANDYRPKWIVSKVLVANAFVMWAGRSKVLKTSLATDLAVSVATGAKFLGHFETKKSTVAMLSGESGRFTIQETVKRIAASRNADLSSADLYLGFDLPQISDWSDIDATAAMILQTKADVVIVDPAYLCLMGNDSGSRQASNVFDMGPLIKRLAIVGEQTNSTIILIHHCRKSPTEGRDRYDPPELEDMAMSGFAEFARQWMLIGRREQFSPGTGNHRLWISVGGSIGTSGLWSLDINEGTLNEDFTGRVWDVSVSSAVDARDQKKREKESRANREREQKEFEHCQQIVKILRLARKPVSKSRLREEANLNTTNASKALVTLQQRGEVLALDGVSKGQTCTLYCVPEYLPKEVSPDRPDSPDKMTDRPACPTCPDQDGQAGQVGVSLP
jgi:predicted transcriptional regulator